MFGYLSEYLRCFELEVILMMEKDVDVLDEMDLELN